MHLRTPAGSDESSSSSGSSGSSQSTKPVADIPSLTGKSTAVTLDAGFVDALTQLKLTPSPVGDATISGRFGTVRRARR